MTKLNFACGRRFARGWVNVDFHSEHPEVRSLNLLRPWPFAEGCFDVVYSSHALEHFSPDIAERILRECHRVMKPGGIIRVVVPDLENSCREYLRILDQVDRSELARRQYQWVILEMLDQLTRTRSQSPMAVYRDRLEAAGDREMIDYVRSRTDPNPWGAPAQTFRDRFRKITFARLKNKLLYSYLAVVKGLIPPSLREAVVDNTRIGEKHRWMYDRHNLSLLLRKCGFAEVVLQRADQSIIPGFNQDLLDINADGTPYKPTSVYGEARKATQPLA